MKEFIKMFFASCLGIMVGMVLIVFFLISIGTASALSGKEEVVKDPILELDFSWVTTERTGNMETDIFDTNAPDAIGVEDIVRCIHQAKKDESIKGIILKPFGVSIGQASLLRIMDALSSFKESDKFIYSYADFYTQTDYLLSSVADSIFLNPNGQVDVRGFSTVVPFFKNGMDDLGVKFDIFYAGNFKSATEPFRLTSMSESSKLQTRSFLTEMEQIMSSRISLSRQITPEVLTNIYNTAGGRSAEKSLENRLVDKLYYWSDVEHLIKVQAGKKPSSKYRPTLLPDYITKLKKNEGIKTKDKIAIIYAEGEVGYGKAERGVITDQEYVKIFHKVYHDDNIKAVVLRVNSPGGSALTSDIIWYEVEKLKAKGIPVVASFGDYAASGGYYIAAGADKIISAPNTLTGSIGVFAMLPNIRGLFNDKLGITLDSVKTHELAVGYNAVMELSDKERLIFQESVDETYQKFLKRVADGRKMTVEEVHNIAQGRVWTGQQGLEIGLVDQIGTLEDAVTEASKIANLEEYKLTEYPIIKKEFYQELLKELSKGMNDEETILKISARNKSLIDLYKNNKFWLNAEGPQARLPYHFNF